MRASRVVWPSTPHSSRQGPLMRQVVGWTSARRWRQCQHLLDARMNSCAGLLPPSRAPHDDEPDLRRQDRCIPTLRRPLARPGTSEMCFDAVHRPPNRAMRPAYSKSSISTCWRASESTRRRTGVFVRNSWREIRGRRTQHRIRLAVGMTIRGLRTGLTRHPRDRIPRHTRGPRVLHSGQLEMLPDSLRKIHVPAHRAESDRVSKHRKQTLEDPARAVKVSSLGLRSCART